MTDHFFLIFFFFFWGGGGIFVQIIGGARPPVPPPIPTGLREDPEQTASSEAVWSGSAPFVCHRNSLFGREHEVKNLAHLLLPLYLQVINLT